MATRIDNPGVFVPPAGVTNDTRLDQQRQQQLKALQEQAQVHSRDEAERVVDTVIARLQGRVAAGGQEPGARNAANHDLTRLVADFQRSAGLPVTGRLDSATFNQLKQQGLTTPAPSTSPHEPAPRGPTDGRVAGNPPSSSPGAPSSSPSAPSLAPGAGGSGAGAGGAASGAGSAAPGAGNASSSAGHAPSSATNASSSVGNTSSSAASSSARASSSSSSTAGRAAPKPEDTAAQRQARSAVDQQARARVDQSAPKREARVEVNQADRVADPARLLASLFNAGFTGKKGNVEDAVRAFQAKLGLPQTGKVDAATLAEMAVHGLLESEAPKKTQSDKPVEPKQQIRRALNESTSKNVADRDVRDPIRPQAPTNKPTTSADVAARAPVTALGEEKPLEQQRVDTVLAQQTAVERGVQEGTGDPLAVAGHGEVASEAAAAGQAGAGGVSGGGAPGTTGQGARAPSDDESVGEESAVGNAKAGDDNFVDDERGNANLAGDGEGEGAGHWSVPLLSEQVRAALERIARDDDGSGPVTYTWDVTFHRPGVYAEGQPAEEIWHVVVHQATAFDPVWQQAADAISSRMLYAEPDGTPPTLEDFILALRRARVR